jgi:DNA polymerase III delta prime subunit
MTLNGKKIKIIKKINTTTNTTVMDQPPVISPTKFFKKVVKKTVPTVTGIDALLKGQTKTIKTVNPPTTEIVEKPKPIFTNSNDSGVHVPFDRDSLELWIEKYRVESLDDIIGNENNLKIIREWFNNHNKKNAMALAAKGTKQDDPNDDDIEPEVDETEMETDCDSETNTEISNGSEGDDVPNDMKKALLFSGPPGLGKTTIAHAILKEFGYQVKEYNASDIRSKKLVQENLDKLINISCVEKIYDEHYKPFGIVMDEVDGMSSGEKGGMAELIQFININRGKRSVKKADKNLANKRIIPPIICICNKNHDTKIKDLKKDCLEIIFEKPTDQQLIKIIDKLAILEKFSIEDSAKLTIAQYAQGDYRRLLFLLQNLYIQTKDKADIITDKFIKENYTSFCQKELDLSIYEMIDKLLNYDLVPNEAIKIYECDKSLLPMMIHENYIDYISIQKDSVNIYQKLDEIQETIDAIIDGDIIDKTMYNNQSWYLQKIHGLNACYIPSNIINQHKKKYFKRSKFTTALGKFSLYCSNKKNINSVINTVNGKNSYSIEDIHIMSDIILYNLLHEKGQRDKGVALLKNYKLKLPKKEEPEKKNVPKNAPKNAKDDKVDDDIVKLIKMNKLSEEYKKLYTSRAKTAIKKLYHAPPLYAQMPKYSPDSSTILPNPVTKKIVPKITKKIASK